MCVCVCVRMFVHVFVHVFMCVCMCVRAFGCVCTYMCVCACDVCTRFTFQVIRTLKINILQVVPVYHSTHLTTHAVHLFISWFYDTSLILTIILKA